MKNSKGFKKIIGCPQHGTTNGAKVIVQNTKYNVVTKSPAYRCNACKRVYMEPEEQFNNGDTGKVVDGLKICYCTGPTKLPEEMYVYDNVTELGICDCLGKFSKRTRGINRFLLPNGQIKKISVRMCRKCDKFFVTQDVLEKNYHTLQKYNVVINDLYQNSIVSGNAENDENAATDMAALDQPDINFETGWEDSIYETDEFIAQENITALQPANRVASAYYDANINYNPYQYLPWLKIFCNESRRLLISDEVGLGKTIEAGILIMEQLTENVNAKVLIICPAFLREKWYQELSEKFFLDSQVYDGKTEIDSMTSIVILPVSRIKQYLEREVSWNYSMVVVDEVHYFKNSQSARYGYLNKLLGKTGNSIRVFMSATPVNNSGNDYRSIERLFGGSPDRTNTTKKQAYIDLPERNIKDIYVDLTGSEQEFYNATDSLDPFSGTIYRHIGSSCLYALSRYAFSGDELSSETKEELRSSIELIMDERDYQDNLEDYFNVLQKTPVPEVDSKLEKLQEILSGYPEGSRIVLFTHYIETVKYLHSNLSKQFRSGYIYANTVSSNIPCRTIKNKFVDAKKWFCEEESQTTILICSDSCREGIDLDIANILINYDLPFNPSILEQRIGRIDRMSQKRNMDIFNFHVNGTYDDRLHFILAAKLRFINYYADYGIGNPLNINEDGNKTFESFIRYFGKPVMDGKNYASMSNDDFAVVARILRRIGIKLKKEDCNAIEMQALLLEKLNNNQKTIEMWFDKGELQKATKQELLRQREELEKLLNFPPVIQRKIVIEDTVIADIVNKANVNPQFRKKISVLIVNYKDKLAEMEITGLPMRITADDIRREYVVGVGTDDSFIQKSVVEVLRNEGAKIYELKQS